MKSDNSDTEFEKECLLRRQKMEKDRDRYKKQYREFLLRKMMENKGRKKASHSL